ncbi:PPPDE putative peptidase domain-containing protein [Neurospora tetraspora]|uniref:PPPDE putative peptidase domain-containing protein n=1 Tax=Neurospora tetraspora TaxID=94610 RepID=A0AAE0MU24_9PEZI|nr:PPPDE putative peptidase domain-containing protein [Neurospora tetraspora]
MGRHFQNVSRVPAGEPNINDAPRKVYIASRFVGGKLGAWTLGLIADLISSGHYLGSMPSPNYHWCVLVGDYYHQLQATKQDGKHWNWYDNNVKDWTDKWELYEVGETRFNDNAIASAGIQAIQDMDEVYRLVGNNCQKFTLKLLDIICADGRKKVYTSYSRHQLKAGFIPGELLDESKPDEKVEVEVAFVEDGSAHIDLLDKAFELMDEKTPTLAEDDKVKEIEKGEGAEKKE